MKSVLALSLLLCSLVVAQAADTVYVNAIAEPGGDGRSWNTAYRYLADGINAWQSGDEIWVARGTYEVQSTGIELDSTKSGIRIYGGFQGNETLRERRDWYRQPTILKATGTRFGIMSLTKCDSLTRIDGLIFENANNIAVSVNEGAPHFRNCVFRDNNSAGSGAAMVINVVGRMRIEYCVFENNTSAFDGGAVFVMKQTDPGKYGAGMLFGQCLFKNNTGSLGGAIYLDEQEASPQFTSCVFYGNKGAVGGALATTKAYAFVTNCTFARNTSTMSKTLGHAATLNGGHVRNCIFWNGDLTDADKLIVDIDVGVSDTTKLHTIANLVEQDFELGFWQNDPQFENIESVEGPDGFFGTDDDGLRLSSFSTVSDGGVIADDGGFVNHRQTDVIGNPRMVGRKPDLGAYEKMRTGRLEPRAMLEEMLQGKLTFFFRHAKTDWDQNDPGPSPECFPGRNLIFEGRAQSELIGKVQRMLGVPIGPVESSPVCRCWETVDIMCHRYEKLSTWGSGGGPAMQRVRDSVLKTIPVGGNRVISSHDAVAIATFNLDGDGRDLTSAELMEGDALFVRPLGDTFEIVGQWCSDTWERYYVRFAVPTSVNEGPCYGQVVTNITTFPSPATEHVVVYCPTSTVHRIVDVNGRVVAQLPEGTTYDLDVSQWPSGLYMVQGGEQSATFVVTR